MGLVKCPKRIASESLLILAFGLKNHDNFLFHCLFYPTVLISGVLFHQSSLKQWDKLWLAKYGQSNQISNKTGEVTKYQRFQPTAAVGILLYTLLNSLYPIILTQRLGSTKYESLYFAEYEDDLYQNKAEDYE